MLNSIRTRLTLWYVGVLAIVVIAFALSIYILVARNLSRTTDNNLAEIGRSIETDLRKEEADIAAERLVQSKTVDEADDDQDEKPADTGEETLLSIEAAIAEEIEDLGSRDYGFAVLDQNNQPVASTIIDTKLQNGSRNSGGQSPFIDVSGESGGMFRVYRMPVTLDGKSFELLITRSLREQTEFLDGLKRIFYFSVPIALLLAGLSGYFLARQSLAPVVSMSRQADRIGSTDLNERLVMRNEKDELGALAKVFNELLTRLETSFEQQKQFMADASHELRTPLAIVRGESEVALSKNDRTAEDYRESLAIVNDESIRLTKIVEDLFTLARADSGQLKPQLTPVYLDEILVECVRAVGSLAKKRDIKLVFSVPAEMPLTGDETLLHRLFLNLLDNAIKYNTEGGTVTIAVQSGVEYHYVTISDTGTGIGKDDQPKIFDRFYRSDKSRTRDNTNGKNGIGLGLSIAAWIARVHQGSVTLDKSDSTGSVFRVQLPCESNSRNVKRP